ncbi:uncharacterized protein P174DRAFT_112718 [Aspergillus novofumigatus IBT 16806]|uniref:Uncharacterized protein n=1 Tax=Aspergillus novofumigatus (strain IBT 16806) TaxID=1392255 RepID=A0A2I1CIT3_ASPN1|nr:uncharacterized protein P174DRAFT_112718 [Aspergillus novofumigatus IBT 16806]PKX97545.1 hypothetical protein P174DRAFT_112718 [Aspergillus novofumigatus IBT 16806]
MRCLDRQPNAVILRIGVRTSRSAMRSPAEGMVPSGSNRGLQCFQDFGQLDEHVLHSLRNELPSRGNLTSSDVPVSQTPMSQVTSPHLCREQPRQEGVTVRLTLAARCSDSYPVDQDRETSPIHLDDMHTPECYTVVCYSRHSYAFLASSSEH